MRSKTLRLFRNLRSCWQQLVQLRGDSWPLFCVTLKPELSRPFHRPLLCRPCSPSPTVGHRNNCSLHHGHLSFPHGPNKSEPKPSPPLPASEAHHQIKKHHFHLTACFFFNYFFLQVIQGYMTYQQVGKHRHMQEYSERGHVPTRCM